MKQLTEDGLIPVSRVSPSRSHSPISEMGKSKSPCRGRQAKQPSVDDLENSAAKLNPGLEGRILQITPEVCNKTNILPDRADNRKLEHFLVIPHQL